MLGKSNMKIKDIKALLNHDDLNLPLEAELYSGNKLYKVVSLWECDTIKDSIVLPSMGKSYCDRHGIKCSHLMDKSDSMGVVIKEFDNYFTVVGLTRLSNMIALKAETNFIKESL